MEEGAGGERDLLIFVRREMMANGKANKWFLIGLYILKSDVWIGTTEDRRPGMFSEGATIGDQVTGASWEAWTRDQWTFLVKPPFTVSGFLLILSNPLKPGGNSSVHWQHRMKSLNSHQNGNDSFVSLFHQITDDLVVEILNRFPLKQQRPKNCPRRI